MTPVADAARERRRGTVPVLIPFQRRRVRSAEIRAVAAALRAGCLAGNGPIGRGVEAALAASVGVRHALLMSSGTIALEAALTGLRVQGGDVILPSFAFASTAAAVTAAGARPVFADIEPRHGTLDPADVRRALTPRTRAIIFVDYAGHPGSLGAVNALAAAHGIPLIEDAAQAYGSSYRSRALGSWGAVGCISFHETKLLACGEGGVLLTGDRRLAEVAARYREYGTNRAAYFRGEVDRYQWVGRGTSGLLAEPLAALLRARLEAMPQRLRRQRELAQRYLEALAPLAAGGLLQLPEEPASVCLNWHLFPVVARDRRDARALLRDLAAHGVEARRHFEPLHRSAHARRLGCSGRALPVTESFAARLVRLPIYPELTGAQQRRILRAVRAWAAARRCRPSR
jgi:dTDP-4-amino-4,6-dideoxygalactose transaminase